MSETLNDRLLRYNFLCFAFTLLAIVLLVLAGAYMAVRGKPYEALGIGGAVTGLIGVIGTFKPKSPTEDMRISNMPTASSTPEPATEEAPGWTR